MALVIKSSSSPFANNLRENGHKIFIDNSNYKKSNDGEISLREQILPTKFFSFNEVGKISKYILNILNYLRRITLVIIFLIR